MERWFTRTFDLGLPASAAVAIIARLETAPDRLEKADRPLRDVLRTHRPGGRWSIQENAGHLLDLEPLWAERLDDFDRGATMLRPADLKNRKTHDARHNDHSLQEILAPFRAARGFRRRAAPRDRPHTKGARRGMDHGDPLDVPAARRRTHTSR